MIKSKSHQIVIIALLTAAAAILSYVESLIPAFIPIPGIKLGLANIATMLALAIFNVPVALGIVAARVFLTGFMFGSLSTILYSLAGGVLSCLVMGLLFHLNQKAEKPLFSYYGISIFGALSHNVGQMAVAFIVLQSVPLVVSYLPFLILAAIPVGLLTGLIFTKLLPHLPKNFKK
ncbi:Gx transporter family protein [Pseudoramibacter sp.]|uniref:Gx transporter family protein n=1 Tax=Pseudoramibacter sp. TaxID=2034862 RepID=UPI0025EA15D8|nr:Gx transporter family protein [Pseudoramibacter sp.]MCH4073161.1 Gx transporter family protein [Pseudoramibacter sp.]MCH4106933.1 Gx transporter family protein [Pseudoramibacter sp.]